MNDNNELWWRNISARCEEHNISQKTLAVFSGISERQFIRLKKNENKLKESTKLAIENALEKLESDEPFKIVIDYIRIRFPTTDVCHIFKNIMGVGMEHTVHEEYAHNGYDECYHFWDLTVSVSQNIKLGCLLEMKGNGCRQFEGILGAQRKSWYDFFLLCTNENGKFKRVDIAINDIYGILNIGELNQKWINKECISKFGSKEYYQSGRTPYQDEKECMGETLYLGSKKSEIYFCIYAKDYEQYIKKKTPLEDASVKNRFEVRLKNERAEITIDELLTYRDIDQTVFDIIATYVRFINPYKSDYDDEVLEPKWAYFIGENRKKIKLTTEPTEFCLERTLNWLFHQVAPSLKVVNEIDNLTGTNHILQIFQETMLSDKHRKLLEQATLPIEELILK